ncbi:MAG: ATP synthase F0 subunit B [Actinobacteria bacterium]|nr:ATP synthase F0 subunit B [Actinomycetota bacterium]
MDEFGVMGLLDELADIIENSKTVLGNSQKRQVEIGPVLDILDEIRESFPEEFREARIIVKDRQGMMEGAEIEANRILNEAHEQARAIVSEQEIVRLANQRAEEILREASERERDMRFGAEDYADQIFAGLEETLGKLTNNVTRCRDRLNNKGGQQR